MDYSSKHHGLNVNNYIYIVRKCHVKKIRTNFTIVPSVPLFWNAIANVTTRSITFSADAIVPTWFFPKHGDFGANVTYGVVVGVVVGALVMILPSASVTTGAGSGGCSGFVVTTGLLEAFFTAAVASGLSVVVFVLPAPFLVVLLFASFTVADGAAAVAPAFTVALLLGCAVLLGCFIVVASPGS